MAKIKSSHTAHFRIGWEPSPDESNLVRYHAVSVDHNRIDMEAKMYKFQEELVKIGPFKIIRQPRRGKVKGTDLEYMFQSFDSQTSPDKINLDRLGKVIIRDYKLYERRVGVNGIEAYVERIYSK